MTTAFRGISCNASVGGSSNSQHLYGNGGDLASSHFTLCQIALAARNHGFSGLLGPGYPEHNDHVHVDSRVENEDDGLANEFFWSAPTCGIS